MIRNRYRVRGTLKLNHSAAVYRAQDLEAGRRVVIKIFHQLGRSDRGRIQSFHRPSSNRAPRPELPAAFVTVHECDLTDEGQLFLVTDLVEGPSIAELLSRTPPLALIRAIELAMRIGEAFEATLNLGLLDLRVTPADIIVVGDGDDSVKLLGSEALIFQRLGLADQLAAAEAADRDPRYASPEELAGLPATERSVTYRFGVLLYELFYGSPPFEGTTPAEVRDRQLRSLPKRRGELDRPLPASLDRLVSQMLAPDPVARPVELTSTLDELWDTMSRLRSEAPALSSHRSISSASTAPRLRNSTLRWAFAGLPILVLGGTFLAWPYLAAVGPSAPSSAPGPVQAPKSALSSAPMSARPDDVAPSAAPVTSPLVLPPSDPNASRDSVATQVLSPSPPIQLPPAAAERPLNKPSADDGGSSARGGGTASAGSGVTQFAIPPAPTAARVANPTGAAVPEQPSSMRPADAPAPRRAAARPEPEATPSRTIPVPVAQAATIVVPPPTRPSDPRTEESRGSDPGAIIDWLVQERPRIVE